jgi:hypothetical protein
VFIVFVFVRGAAEWWGPVEGGHDKARPYNILAALRGGMGGGCIIDCCFVVVQLSLLFLILGERGRNGGGGEGEICFIGIGYYFTIGFTIYVVYRGHYINLKNH